MAKRVSDHILCIDGRYVDRYGTPEEVFTDQYVSGLFGITAGSFDETGEDLELENRMEGRGYLSLQEGAWAEKASGAYSERVSRLRQESSMKMIWIILRQRRFLLRLSAQEALSL